MGAFWLAHNEILISVLTLLELIACLWSLRRLIRYKIVNLNSRELKILARLKPIFYTGSENKQKTTHMYPCNELDANNVCLEEFRRHSEQANAN